MAKIYIGGHSKVSTSMKGTSWGTYDPADPAEPKPSKQRRRKAGAKPSTKEKTGKKPSSAAKVLRRQKESMRQASRRIDFITAVLAAVSSKGSPPHPFKKLTLKVKKDIAKANSVREWAESQPEYSNVNNINSILFEERLRAAEEELAPLDAELQKKIKSLSLLEIPDNEFCDLKNKNKNQDRWRSDLQTSIARLKKERMAVEALYLDPIRKLEEERKNL